MKHCSNEDAQTYLRDLLDAVGVTARPSDLEKLCRYADAILEENRRVNLTAIRDLAESLRLHVADSAAALPEVRGAAPGGLTDLGTGAGFPGVPLSLLGDRTAFLLDATRRKVEAVRRALETAGINGLTPVWSRAEEWAVDAPPDVTVVTARAVAELPTLLELASPLLRKGGRFVALKGVPTEDELRRAEQAAAIVGFSELSRRTLELPLGLEVRTVISYEKTSESAIALPRRVGLAVRKPLA